MSWQRIWYLLRGKKKEIEELKHQIKASRKELDQTKQKVHEWIKQSTKFESTLNQAIYIQQKVFSGVYLAAYEVSNTFGSSDPDYESAYQFILNIIQDTMKNERSGSPRLNIFVRDPEDPDQLKPHAMEGHRTRAWKNRIQIKNNEAAGYTFLNGESYFDYDTTRDFPESRFKSNPHSNRPILSIICVPIKCGDDTIGVLSVTGEQKYSFTEDDKSYLELFSGIIAPMLIVDLKREGNIDVSIREALHAANETAAGDVSTGGNHD